MPRPSLLLATLSIAALAPLIASCASDPSGDAPAVSPEPAAPGVDCDTAGGMCLPNTNTAPPTYRQAKSEEGVCKRRDEICWLRL